MTGVTITGISSAFSVWSDRYHGIILPWCSEVATKLQLPAWNVYKEALGACTRDFLVASSSAYTLCCLTLKPVAILVWILLGHFWRFVLEHGGRSLHTGAIHLRLACIHFYRFQVSLDATQLLGEAGLVLVCVGLYYLRKWIQRQTYWAKFVKWYRAQKRRFVEWYTDTVHKIAKVSKILAMALPHLLFFGLGVGLKIALPGLIRWVTYETPVTDILTLYYPFVSTLVWVHTKRHYWGENNSSNETKDETAETDATNASTENNNNNEKKGTSSKQKGKSRTKSRISDRKQTFEANAKGNNEKETSSPEFVSETTALATTKYWLNYWQLYAVTQAVGSCLSMVPIVGRFLVSHPFIGFLTGECKLFFFVWVFGMEKLLGKTSRDAFLAEALPLRLIHKFVTPVVLRLHSLVSDAISKNVWQKWVVSKTKTTLDIAVMVRAISEDRKDWLVHVAEEFRVLALPSITLLMPGFVTQFGVAYVRYVVPSAKSAEVSSKAMKLVYLQYWILHCGTAGLLQKLQGVLWWVPFSTHMVFLLWSYLILPRAIKSWYGILESELVAFGILPGSSRHSSSGEEGDDNRGKRTLVAIRDTKTAWLFQSLVDMLPSAVTEGNNETENTDHKDDSSSSLEHDGDRSRAVKANDSTHQQPDETTTSSDERASGDQD